MGVFMASSTRFDTADKSKAWNQIHTEPPNQRDERIRKAGEIQTQMREIQELAKQVREQTEKREQQQTNGCCKLL
jgi:hypothetical protein